MPEIEVREAIPEDAEAIARIYNHYILESTATFHLEPVSADDRVSWIVERSPGYPTLVAEENGLVRAWGSLSRYAPRPGWDPTAEVAVYVEPGHTGHGIGPRLMDELIVRAKSLGFHTLVSQIEGGNGPSIILAERAGFHEVGRLREAGLKFDRRLDVVIMQRILETGE